MNVLRLAIAVATVLCAVNSAAQSQQTEIPPGLTRAQRAEEKSRANMPPPLAPQRATLPQELNKDAAELSRLALQIQTEVQAANKGVLSKDLDAHLKELEKLSKKLRGELRP